ncbi:N-acetylmuramoyl-L-alanine amidase [Lysinibacillus sp. 54212]|uniref:N-acetylmuramoyl-L-alanine amidase n=1 Tax=Lysinibacillus sp. 54212 TaxID=3119829 RepID=UPI002FC84956
MIKVAYDAGHFYNTPGKRTPDGEREWTFNDKVASAFANELALYKGVMTKRFDDPTGITDIPLKERTDGANGWGADYYFSFHKNANTAQWGNWTGVETWIYSNASAKSIALANAIHPTVVAAYGLRDRGIKKGDLHILRETKMPAILIEGPFMDSIIDINKLRDITVLEKAGKLVARALARYLGLKRIISEEDEEETLVTQPIYEKDAKPSEWAASAVEWAKENGISDGTYLKRPATREEVITMLYNMQTKLK